MIRLSAQNRELEHSKRIYLSVKRERNPNTIKFVLINPGFIRFLDLLELDLLESGFIRRGFIRMRIY